VRKDAEALIESILEELAFSTKKRAEIEVKAIFQGIPPFQSG
jgi:hypothetical protein